MATDNYDISSSLRRTEERLIEDLIKQLKKPSSLEMIKNGDVDSWVLDQLKELELYKKRNGKYFTGDEKAKLLEKIDEELIKQYGQGREDTRLQISNAIKRGFESYNPSDENITASFSGVNDRKLQALINETTNNIYKAEYAALRYSDDQYRKIIFDAQTYFQTGSGTLAQAIDMATKDFLSNGIKCVEYKDGRKVDIQSYSEMALRTANKRAYMQGEASMRDEYGLDLVIVTRRGNACPKCMQYVGKIFIDDVYGNGKADGKYPLLSSAIAGGLYHPNCRDVHTTYFEGITTVRPEPTEAEKQEANRIYELEQHQRYLERNVRKYDRLYKGAVDEKNQQHYLQLKNEWQKRTNLFVKNHYELRRRYYREKAVTLPNGTISSVAPPKPVMNEISKLKSQMTETDYNEFRAMIEQDETLTKMFNENANKGTTFTLSSKGGIYRSRLDELEFSYPKDPNLHKYETLAHESGHMIDYKSASTIKANYGEVDAINKKLKSETGVTFDFIDRCPSHSDEFLAAMRTDGQALVSRLNDPAFIDGFKSSPIVKAKTSGIQDFMDGLAGTQDKGIFSWGHGDTYYNKLYNRTIKRYNLHNTMKSILTDLGMDASNQTKVKQICRDYRTATEVWANAFSALCVGGDELKYFEQYCPNIIKTIKKLLKGDV